MSRMDKGYNDPTSERAIGATSKDWKTLAKIAVLIREGRCNPSWASEKSQLFTGIFRRLMEDPIDEIKRQIKGW